MYPAKHEGKSNSNGNNATPHEEHVSSPAKFAASKDEHIKTEFTRHSYKPFLNIMGQVSRLQEDLPTSLPIKRGRRSLQPHRISIGDAEGGKEYSKGIADECSVEVREVS